VHRALAATSRLSIHRRVTNRSPGTGNRHRTRPASSCGARADRQVESGFDPVSRVSQSNSRRGSFRSAFAGCRETTQYDYPWDDWNHILKLDPDKELPAGVTYGDLCATGTDAIEVGGTMGITEET